MVPFHPEMEGTVKLENGEPIPFEKVKCSDGVFVPIYTSEQRAIQSVKKLKSGSQKCVIAEMDGLALFKTLYAQNLQAVINPACDTDPLFFPFDAVKKLADGSALQSVDFSPRERGTVKVVEPADYPTDFIQPLFDYLRKQSEISAVWLLQQTNAATEKTVYVLGVVAEGNVEQLRTDLTIVGHPVCPKEAEFGVALLDLTNPEHKSLIVGFTPFYAAAGFVVPPA
jgi:hypothetical protein